MIHSMYISQRETILTIEGTAGKLEAIFTLPSGELKPIIAVVCHPHSLYGGSMDNKVVTTVVRTLRELGIRSVRFNFRGVGKSAGQYDEGRGETEDTLAILKYLSQHFPGTQFWLAGFSFGSYVSFKAALEWPVTQLISIAPPVNHFTFATEMPICPWVIVQGEADEIVPASQVLQWIEQLPRKVELIYMREATHFFHGRLVELREKLQTVLIRQLPL